MRVSILDLFSGIGGFSLALQRAGFTIKNHYASEIDKYAQMIYRRNFNGSVQLGDVTKIGNELGEIDFITGGFPCQAFSIAGKRRGFEDTRGTLFFEIERLAKIYRPSYMVLENVKGLFSHERGNTIRVILDRLRRLDYSVQVLLLNSKDFGVPQNRERIFFVCSAPGRRKPEISCIRERKTEITFSANCIDANYYKGIDNPGQRTCIEIGTKRGNSKDGQRIYSDQGNYSCLKATGEMNAVKQVVPVLSPDRVEKRQNGRRFKGNGEPSFTLTAQDKHGVMLRKVRTEKGKALRKKYEAGEIEHGYNEHRKLIPKCENISNTLSTFPEDNLLLDQTIIRRLTPVECERLQDYPDDWTKYGLDESGKEREISDTQRYRCCGNSITVKVAEEIFKAIGAVGDI